MAEKYSSIKWFLEELPKLKSLGLVDESTNEKLKSHYQERLAKAPSMQNFFLMMLVAVGALLISCGVIMLFAFNWDMLPKAIRIGAAFMPLILAGGLGVYTIVKDKNQSWRESSALGISASIAILTALISQIYNTGGTLPQFMMLVLGLSLPLIYIFNSRVIASIYAIELFILFSGNYHENVKLVLTNLAYVAALLPFVFYQLKNGDGISKVWMRYLCIPLALFILINTNYNFDRNPIFMFFATAALFYYAGVSIRDSRESYFSNPWLTVSYFFITILLAIGTYQSEVWNISIYKSSFSYTYMGFEITLLLGIAVLVFLDFLKLRMSMEKAVTAILPLFALLIFIVGKDIMPILMNFYFAAFGIILLIEGFKKRSLPVFNAGVLQIVILILCRFFDTDLGILEKAIAFIIIGIAFIVTNVFISKKFKTCTEVKNV